MHVASAVAQHRQAIAGWPIGFVLLGSLALAALTLLIVAPAPSYDPWAWLLWGRELAGGELNTEEGPAFKPLPVAVCAVLSALGPAAPWAWVLVARAGAVLAILLAFRLGRRLAGGSVLAGTLAAVAVAFCGEYLAYAASGVVTGLVLALALGGVEAWRAGRPRTALACGVGCGLLQVEAWPFLLVAGVALWRRRPQDRAVLGACAVAVPALWLVPELLGSGDLLRSAERARIPNPGQPALADVPALASLWEAALLPLWPLWIGVVALVPIGWRRGAQVRPAIAAAAAGLAWIAVVAAMAQTGFSGEPRYALPGAALLAVSGAVGLVALVARPAHTLAAAAVVGLVAIAALPRLEGLPLLHARQAYQWQLASDLADAVRAAGGRDAVLACGQPYVGPQRGPLMAYRLGVAKHRVEPDLPPRFPGVVFHSRLTASGPGAPAAPPAFTHIARTGRWRVLVACRIRIQ